MVGQGLEWGEWKQILKARSVAQHTVDGLNGKYISATSSRKKMGVLCDNTKSSSFKACDHYEAS